MVKLIVRMSIFCLGFGLLSNALASDQQRNALETLVAQAVMPLPPSLQSGATVISVNDEGEKKVLRKGSNDMMCRADSPATGFLVMCYHKRLDNYLSYSSSNAANDSPVRNRDYLLDLVEKGTITPTKGGILYRLRGDAVENAVPMSVIFIPNLTAATTGFANVPDPHQPWLMWEGTPLSHVMIPGK
jgi:hypothetical protein